MFKSIFLCVALLSALTLSSQSKINNNWVFGYYGGLNFNTNPPSFLNNCVINSIEACGSISDDNGNLLFYSDGVTVRNRNHVQMPNGFGLLGHNSSTQGAFIVPYPGHPNLYYLFVMDWQAGTQGGGCACLSYSIIDMDLQSGLGDVISKNTILYTNVTEKLASVKNTNNTGTWLIAHEYGTNNFLSFAIDTSGINATPVVSPTGSNICCDPAGYNTLGQMKIASNGKKLGMVTMVDALIELFDFDTSTGVISNPVSFSNGDISIYGFEFSPNANLIYVTNDSHLWQFDISSWNSSTILNSMLLIDHTTLETFGQLQLGPDSKIYMATNDQSYLNVIANPNSLGSACNFLHNAVILSNNSGFGKSWVGLPNRVVDFNNTDNLNTSDTLCEVIIPNVITPNNDQINDEFKVKCFNSYIIPEDLVLYNRWGQEVYNAQQKSKQLETLTNGTYYYLFSLYGNNYKGFISVFK